MMTDTSLPPASYSQDSTEFADRLFNDVLGAFNIFAVHIGDQLGLYRELAKNNGLSSADLAERTGTHERYVREWLEQQAAACVLEVQESPGGKDERRYFLPPGRAEVLTDRDSLNYMAPLAQLVAGAVSPMDALLDSYRTGGGVPYSQFGVNLREGQASMNRPMFLQQLGEEWLPAVPDVHDRLQADPPARVADIGCGAGWSCIGIAQSYPKVRVDGYDLDDASVELANLNIHAAGLKNRVHVFLRDASDLELQGIYDLVVAFECLHDMSDPVRVLRMMRLLANDKGSVIVMDERSLEEFRPCAGELEQYLYGFSILHCLPAGMSEQPSAGTGTVLRPSTLERYAKEAGFSQVEILPIDHFFFRFYHLVK
jgi:2-polyprenyl-3-methyl-5-hydroxy-6-metoxy-1,4-benzoquinol methylase